MRGAQDLMWTSVWLMGILLIGMFGLIIALKLRKRPRPAEPQQPFSIGQLKRMRETGDITEAEFQSMRSVILRQMGARVTDDGGSLPRPESPPPGDGPKR